MTRQLGIPAFALLLVGLLTPTLNGSYSIIHPASSAQILTYGSVECDGTCPEGDTIRVELWNYGNKIRWQLMTVGPFSETWAHSFSAPTGGWIEGSGWSCKLRQEDYTLEYTINYTVVGFGA